MVISDGKSGGLLLLWKKELVVSLRYKMSNYIDVFVGSNRNNVWRFPGLYGEPKWQDKYKAWKRLRDLHATVALPWLVMGDFNEILYPFEKEGGNLRPVQFMENFRYALDDCGLSDCGYIGEKFTWHRGGIRERLDRVVANEAWKNRFVDGVLQNLDYGHSDHRPILMCTDKVAQQEFNVPYVLRFEAMAKGT